MLSNSPIPPGWIAYRGSFSGDVAALNHRLMSMTPTGVGVCHWPILRLSRSRLANGTKTQSSFHPGGMPEISRWLSEATPPEPSHHMLLHPGGMPEGVQ